MNIELKDKNGITLKTAGKYCSSDVGIIPKLQSKSVATNGSVVADEGYCGLDSVTVAVPATPTQEKTVDLAMASGNQVISPDAGKNLSKVTVTKPSTLVAENIKTGVSIGGVTGTLEVKKEEEAGTATITENGSQTFSPTSGKVFSDFTVTTNVPTGVDISDTTAVANDVRKGKTFYSSDGTKTQGIIENYGGASLSMSTATLTKAQYGMSAVAIGNKIYLHGQNKNFELFDTETNGYSLLDAVADDSTYYAPIAAIDKKIYLFGGAKKGIGGMVVFDTETDVVEDKILSHAWESGCSGASVGNKIYLFGSDTLRKGTTINVYNVTDNTFTKSNVALPISAGYIAACAIDDKIYLFGGHNTDKLTSVYGTFLDSINVFDTTNNTISTLDVKLPVGMRYVGVAALGTKIYLFGGNSDKNKKFNTIYEFDILTNTIKKLDVELPDEMHSIAAVTVNDKIYLFGGYGNNRHTNFIQIFSPKTSVLITSKDGEALPTNGKYCVSDITVQPALEIKTITSNGEALPSENYCGFEKVMVNVQTAPKLQTKTVTPTKSQQSVSPDSGYDGLSGVTVNAIPDNYVIPTGTVSITTNGTHDVSGKASANVNIPATPTQEKTVELAMASGNQTITPTSGKVLSQVVVKKPATMLPENIKKDVNIGGVTGTLEIGGGGELNIAYGNTAPEDTSKLWVKTTEPDSVEISPEFGYGEAVQITGTTQNSIFGSVIDSCEFGDSVYLLTSSYVYKMNKFTLNYSTLFSVSDVCSICIFDNKIFYLKLYTSGYDGGGPYSNRWSYKRVKLYSYDLTTHITSEIIATGALDHYFGKLVLYNDKIHIVGGGYYYSYYYNDYRGSGAYYTMATKVTVYTPATNVVETFSASLGNCLNVGICLIGNKVYTFGGANDTTDNATQNASIHSINLDTQTCENCSSVIPIATSKCAISNLENIVYISGGLKTASSVYMYNTETDTIEQLNVALDHARTTCVTFFNDTELYLLGSNSIVDKLQINVPLLSTKLKIISDWLKNQFAIISGSAKVMMGVNKVFKGDANGKAKEVTAYVHDGINWHDLNGEIILSKLYAPKISISGKTLTITNDGRNSDKVTNYKVYNGNTLLTSITATTLDLTTVITANGTYNISVIATGTGYTDSDSSNVVEYNYASYSITTNLTNVTANASNPTTVSTVASSTLTFTASTGYNLPDNVTVTGAEFTWTKSSGTLVLSNPTGAVSVTIAGVAISRTITATLTNVTAASGNATTIATGETKVLTYTAASGYTLPDSVTVTGATGVWNKDAGTLTLSNPTANVTFTIAGVEATPSGYRLTITQVGYGSGSANIVYADGTAADVSNAGTYNNVATVRSVEYNLGGYVMKDSSGGSHNVPYNLTSDTTLEIEYQPCMIEGTQITLADGSTKAIEDITYDDELLVWNFYAGRFDKAKPSWIKVEQTTPRYCLVKFSNGAEVGFVGPGEHTRQSDGGRGYHRIFNKEAGAFTYVGTEDTPNGTTTFAQDGSYPTVVSQEVVEKEVKFYNVITDKHYNLFANGILTSCRLSNKYRIEDMRYIGEKLISDEQEKAYFERIENKRK